MSTITAAVPPFFQTLLDPSPSKLAAFLIGLFIGFGLIYFARQMAAKWKEKNRLIEQLCADNDAQQQQLADLHNAIFGSSNQTSGVVVRHRMVVRWLHDVMPMVQNRDGLVKVLMDTDDHLRSILAAARGMTLSEFDANAHDHGLCLHSGFGYEGTYGKLQSAPKQPVAPDLPRLGETFALDRAILRAVERIISDALPGSDPLWPRAAAEMRLARAMPALGIGSLVIYPPKALESVRITLESANEAIAKKEVVNSAQSDEARRESIREQYRPDYGDGPTGV